MRVLYFTRGWTAHDLRFLSALVHSERSEHRVFFLRLEDSGPRVEVNLPPGVESLGSLQSFRSPRSPFPSLGAQGPLTPAYENQKVEEDGVLEADLSCLPNLQRILQAVQPDLIHAGPIQRVARLAARTGFHPLISMSWGSDLLVEADIDQAWGLATREALDGSTLLLGDCQAVRHKAAALGFPNERIITFPWGVDLEHFSPGPGTGLRQRLGWQDAFILLCVRSWEPIYGVDVVARAFVQAAQACPQLRLVLLGGGSQAGQVRQILEQAGVMERVFFGGTASLQELPDYYRSADLYLSASHSDGSSVSLLEALACGRPALVSDIAGNREWVAPGEVGWLFPDGDEQALAAAILEVVREGRLEEMRHAARRLAEERADWRRSIAELLRAYELAAHGPDAH